MATTERTKSLEVAEESREKEWSSHTFLRDLFLGDFRLDLIHPFPDPLVERPEFRKFYDGLEKFLREDVDPDEIDRLGDYPDKVVDGLRRLGAFGMKIPEEYGGLGFTQREYGKVMELLGSYDGNLIALLSAHQSIGVPQPLMLFGTEEQKKKFLPRCAKGAISAFALTEPAVGSDPASLSTTARPTPDGKAYILEGEKLWCTNGTKAELLVVMARNPDTDRISAFVVETSWEGVELPHRCHFMGLRALANGVVIFRNVRVPRENLIGKEGQGLKIALTTLNTGRLTLPAATVGMAKQCLEICRKWGLARVQWGEPIGRHEAISRKLAQLAATTYAMESVHQLADELATRPGYDIRLEAAAAKEWNTVKAWELVDDTLQIRGGRGYETADSLEARGEPGVPVERMMRDSRINLIFEGSSEIMHLFMAREAVDKHLHVAGPLVYGRASGREKLDALPKIAAFYARWYPTRWTGWGRWPRYESFGRLARHLRFVERTSRKLARSTFHGMMVYRGGMQHREGFLFRVVDIAMELFAMSASICRAQRMAERHDPAAAEAIELADLFCRTSRKKVRRLFVDLWFNQDSFENRVANKLLEGKYAWLEEGIMGLGLSVDDLRPSGRERRMARASGAEYEPEEANRAPPPAPYS
ncbi:acyl-CoA dehydrogenase family protein [Vulgatibacter incomptus]|uniref:Butyryl-CoA dehydrogenase n=1 Tax=Vulgatibacter incomptus TaxID=1391653 RepID=A0A0K1PFR9_9BACT|nr:acyl-CoA dehydrogenase family protein [Vulgatibacter incomptus]AKU92256.1 Butyryl-CoA dehydrogenase [Vulgatibacter incomptus]